MAVTAVLNEDRPRLHFERPPAERAGRDLAGEIYNLQAVQAGVSVHTRHHGGTPYGLSKRPQTDRHSCETI